MLNRDKTILIVDDSKLNIQVLSDILKEKSYRISLARSGRMALEFVNMKKPDLILLDIMMPEIDGFEVCSRLKADPETKNIPIIFISGLDKSKDIVKGLKAGAVDYIVKPFQKEVVLARVNTHLKLSETQRKLEKTNNELKELLKEVEYLSFHDEMTGLYNRRYFENELKRLASSRRLPITLMVADLDKLKLINDNYGHKMGDQYIKGAAEVLKESSRNEDIVARIGGDEFAIILPETGFEAADKIYQRLKFNLKKYNQQQELVVELRLSLGFAVKTKNEQNLDQIFKKADKIMYNNKRKKKYYE
ncbi:response regulator receiver modulated diguanylate cyclase [Halanaerobium saccharolyticum]|uniref:Stage 0 sporulation protein A homolog n=1 Tax=Halanaerobium saccharolyticum TaxID=43595 RepID=A0A4R7Z256_9FIRM|nr:diguanylate cyclase [Halanaerobium saccharolyticum]RAK08124.1 response regulator receiver modulated diguanylate cyclase [Halanaerobium saccharolyticum]TDW04331.1 response regulator receiver modulated diguanylate cyclase [Halanaerobium saccharolyticum]TDX59622.1 response regulator receiver modulated diguanylate cyclase [Halanaerobium saccharolyticum]